MTRTRTLVLVLAGGAGGRLELLTDSRAKPVTPFAGTHRLVDVVLSNCLHSGLSDVWVVEQQHPASLGEHLANGRPWDLDRTTGGLLLLPPRLGDDREGFSSGTADVLWRHADLVREFAAEALVVVSADAVYRLDYDALVAEHVASGGLVTMVTTRVAADDAGRYGVVRAEAGRVVDYAYKPEEPDGDLVANEVFVLTPGPVLDRLEALAADAGEDGLQDLGTALLPSLVADGVVREHRLPGYWRDLGTVEAYWSAHQDLLGPDPLVRVDGDWPLLTRGASGGPSRVLAGSTVVDSLLSPGSVVAGHVERSVLSPGVVVEEGAVVVDSVLLHDVVVRRGAQVRRAVLDDGVEVAAGVRVGGEGELALVGHRAHVERHLAAGARLPEQSD